MKIFGVGGSAWELDIHRKRLQDKENNDVEEGDETTQETITYIWPEKVAPNKFLS